MPSITILESQRTTQTGSCRTVLTAQDLVAVFSSATSVVPLTIFKNTAGLPRVEPRTVKTLIVSQQEPRRVHASSTKKDSSAADPMQYLESDEETTMA